jgi:hypothetical protein
MKELKGVDEKTLPKKWAIKTDRQEFWDWFNRYKKHKGLPDYTADCGTGINFDCYCHYPIFDVGCHTSSKAEDGYELITFEYWCRVKRPDLLEGQKTVEEFASKLADELNGSDMQNYGKEFFESEIPAKWCVRRTPENAEVLNAWYKSKRPNKWLTSCDLYISNDLDFYHNPTVDYPEITFDQWQTIPEVAEWINKDGYFVWREWQNKQAKSKKVEEREIIGYKAPFDIFDGMFKKGTLYITEKWRSNYHPHNNTVDLYRIPKEWVETWAPVYREVEKPAFKVGDWVKLANGNIGPITTEGDHSFWIKTGDSCSTQVSKDSEMIFATPEEIEAARPKRKYMKQYYRIAYGLGFSDPFDTKEDASAWLLENAIDGNEYTIQPFEVLAYE